MTFWEYIQGDAKVWGVDIDPQSSLLTRLNKARKLMRWRPGFACVFWLRVNQHIAGKRGSVRLRNWRNRRFACDLSERAVIGPGLYLSHPIDVVIGSGSKVGKNVTLFNGVTLGSTKMLGTDISMPTLGDNVIVYTGAKLIGGIKVGDRAQIGALSLCRKDVPADHIFYGIPPNITIKPL